jgi:serine/threonine protein kinase
LIELQGANILTTKEGLVKLADFGVAAKVGSRSHLRFAAARLASGRHPQGLLESADADAQLIAPGSFVAPCRTIV